MHPLFIDFKVAYDIIDKVVDSDDHCLQHRSESCNVMKWAQQPGYRLHEIWLINALCGRLDIVPRTIEMEVFLEVLQTSINKECLILALSAAED